MREREKVEDSRSFWQEVHVAKSSSLGTDIERRLSHCAVDPSDMRLREGGGAISGDRARIGQARGHPDPGFQTSAGPVSPHVVLS